MSKIGITADSSSCIAYAPFKHTVKITKTTIDFNGQILTDGVDVTADQFYEMLEKTDIIPTTAAPVVGEINDRCLEWKKEGKEEVIHFPISSGLSAYGPNMAIMTDELFPDIKVTFFPTKQVCIMQAYLAHYAEILASHGVTTDEIIAKCDAFQKQIHSYFIVDNLRYLVKNGRLKVLSGFVGQLMNIKPILIINDEGEIVPFEKVRTKNKAVDRIIDLVCENNKQYKKGIYVCLHAHREDEAYAIIERIKARTSNALRYEVSTITPTVGAHIGSGLLGVTFIPLDDLEYQDEI